MRAFIEQIGDKQIMTDQWPNLDGVRNHFYVVDQVKKLCQCVKRLKEN